MKRKELILSSELVLLALLSRPYLDNAQVASAAALINDADVGRLHELVNQHRIWPCVYCNLRDYFPDLLVDSSFDYLKTCYQQTVAQSRHSFILCGNLLRDFKEYGVELRILKGAPLAFKLYGDVSKRHSFDIDLVVKETDLDVAHAILTRQGFQSEGFEGLSEKQKDFYWDRHKDVEYFDKFGTKIELHVRLSNQKFKVTDQYLNALFNRTLVDNIGHLELLYLCWHGIDTLFHRLKWLVDIALYLELQSAASREDLVKIAKELKATRLLSASWVLAHKIFDTDLPDEILTLYQQDSACRVLVSQCLKNLHNTQSRWPSGVGLVAFGYISLIYETNKSRSLYFYSQFKPTLNDINWLPRLPDRLYFLYYLLRPLRVIYSYFQRDKVPVAQHASGKVRDR
jgi:hypothetical protein